MKQKTLQVDSQQRRRLLQVGAASAAAVLGSSMLVACGGADNSPPVLSSAKAMRVNNAPVSADGGANTVVSIALPESYAFKPDAIHVAVLGSSPTESSQFGYVDLTTGTFVATGSGADFALDPAMMTVTLAQLVPGAAGYQLNVPRIVSGRVYLAFGQGFDKMPSFGSGGPPNGPMNPVLYDKFELHTADNPNINYTNVDFFSVAFSVAARDVNTGAVRSIGFSGARSKIIDALRAPDRDDSSENGNPSIFGAACVLGGDRSVVRVLSPKSCGLTDWLGTSLDAQAVNSMLFTHYWDAYINQHCWRPGRTFSCYSKLLDGNVYYGRVSNDGTHLSLYANAAMTRPYITGGAPLVLPRPSAPWGEPNYAVNGGNPELYHNTDSTRGYIDWGFLLGGNAGSGSGDGAHWNSDPVAMAIVMSICRGVMHYDDGCKMWVDPAKYYCGTGDGRGTADMPIFWYAKVLHDNADNGLAYAFSYDDVYGRDPSIYFYGSPDVQVTLSPM